MERDVFVKEWNKNGFDYRKTLEVVNKDKIVRREDKKIGIPTVEEQNLSITSSTEENMYHTVEGRNQLGYTRENDVTFILDENGKFSVINHTRYEALGIEVSVNENIGELNNRIVGVSLLDEDKPTVFDVAFKNKGALEMVRSVKDDYGVNLYKNKREYNFESVGGQETSAQGKHNLNRMMDIIEKNMELYNRCGLEMRQAINDRLGELLEVSFKGGYTEEEYGKVAPKFQLLIEKLRESDKEYAERENITLEPKTQEDPDNIEI